MELVKWDKIQYQIETAKDIEELTSLKDRLRAYQILAEQSKQSMETQSKIAIYKARVDRRCGEWLKDNIHAGNPQLSNDTTIKLNEINITRDESSRLKKIADIPEEKFEAILQEAEIETKKITNNMLVNIAKESKAHVSYNSGNNEWYTPAEYIEKARDVLINIDLDPASNDKANKIIKAKRYYTAKDNGLSKDWSGKVWMNPPYASDLIKSFCEKFIIHFESGDISEGIVLTNNATDTEWFHIMAVHATAICFPRGRIKFWSPDKDNAAPLQGQVLMYFGDNGNKFKELFEDFGVVFNA